MALTKLNARSATALDATILTGNLPAISGASLTGISTGKIVQTKMEGNFNLPKATWPKPKFTTRLNWIPPLFPSGSSPTVKVAKSIKESADLLT